MSLEKILHALQAEAEAEMARLELAAQAELEQIAGDAQAQATVARQSHLTAIQAPLRAERARILNQARLDALRVVLGTREALIESTLQVAASRLRELRGTEPYGRILHALTTEACAVLGTDEPVCLRIESPDMELMQGIAEGLHVPASVEGGLENHYLEEDPLGGVEVSTADGRINLNNTFAIRLRRVARRNRSQIAELLLHNA